MTYQLKENNGISEIIERATSQVVLKTKKYSIARAVCRSLNLGSGFAGETPSFFCPTD